MIPSVLAKTGRPTSRSNTWRLCAPFPNLLCSVPADAVETAECWEIALEQARRPSSGIALTRQNLPTVRTDFTEENLCALWRL
jgi:transketolase